MRQTRTSWKTPRIRSLERLRSVAHAFQRAGSGGFPGARGCQEAPEAFGVCLEGVAPLHAARTSQRDGLCLAPNLEWVRSAGFIPQVVFSVPFGCRWSFLNPVPSGLRCESHHDVKSGGEFADARAFDGREIHGHRGARLRIRDRLVNPVTLILWLAFDVTLRRPLLAPLHLDREMDVPRASRVKHRLDGAKIVFAAGAGQKAAEALKVFFSLCVRVAAVQIDAVIVH